jgi:hypothetical protein
METDDGQSVEFEVVAILEDEESHEVYALLEALNDDEAEAGAFLVTDEYGVIVHDQDVIDEVLAHAEAFLSEASDDDEESHEGHDHGPEGHQH